jgi:hypothetical protein
MCHSSETRDADSNVVELVLARADSQYHDRSTQHDSGLLLFGSIADAYD